jgi:hypothetical protein
MKDMKKTICIGVLLLICFFSSNIGAGGNQLFREATLTGYVTEFSEGQAQGNPVEGAYIRVSFHDTFLDDYSDGHGFYHISGIPECRCLKNVTVSKSGYQSETVWLIILGDVWYNFTLTEI